MSVLLVRHFETKSNQLGLFGDGPLDDVPTPRGKEQATALGTRLSTVRPEIACIIHGPSIRQAVTARAVAELLPSSVEMSSSSLLREQGVGVWAGKSKMAISAEELSAWRAGKLLPPEAESDNEFDVRMQQLWDEIVAPAVKSEKNHLVVTSGNIIRFVVAEIIRTPWRNLLPALDVDNCGITTIREKGGNLFLGSVNDVSHLAVIGMAAIA